MKTIFITSFHSLISRNILQAGILSGLVKNNIEIVLLVPEKKVKYFQKFFGGEHVIIEGVSVPKKRLEDFLYFVSLSLVDINNHVVDDWKENGHYFKYYIAVAIHALFSRFFFFHKLIRTISKLYLYTNVFEALFVKYKPSLIFTTDSFYREDRSLIVEAKKKGITTVGMIRSWDNATTKGVLLAEPDSIIVPNGVLKEELVSIHHISPKKITITGIPHYDKVSHKPSASKEEFFKEMGLSLKKKTILFAPAGKILYKHDGEILTLLKKHLNAGRFNYPVQFLVRLPPGDTVNTESIENDDNFITDSPGTKITKRKKDSELSQSDNMRLSNSILYSDIVLTLVSTMAIDGTVFNKPVVIFGFEPKKNLQDSVNKFADCAHFKKFLDSGLITISHSEDELVSQINMGLKNPDYNKVKRGALIDRYAYKLDGKSSKRVLSVFLNFFFDKK